MLRREKLCHELAELNEVINDCWDSIRKIKLNLLWDHKNRDWYLAQSEALLCKVAKYQQDHDALISKYGDIINP